jgi:hypothetical protein
MDTNKCEEPCKSDDMSIAEIAEDVSTVTLVCNSARNNSIR